MCICVYNGANNLSLEREMETEGLVRFVSNSNGGGGKEAFFQTSNSLSLKREFESQLFLHSIWEPAPCWYALTFLSSERRINFGFAVDSADFGKA